FSLTGDLLTHLLPDTAAAAATVRQNRHAVRSVGRCVRGGGRDALHGVECSYDVATDLGRQHDDDVPPRGWPVDLVNGPLHLVETSRDGHFVVRAVRRGRPLALVVAQLSWRAVR